MTDQELKELEDTRDDLRKKRENINNIFEKEHNDLIIREMTLEGKIIDETRRRSTATNKEKWKEKVKNFFETYEYAPKREAKELWMVEVNGKKLRSSKGKYTWTSENRAFKGVCDYIYYNSHDISHAIDSNELELGDIIESLIDDGYIKISRVL